MALYLATVLGYSVCLAFVLLIGMHFVRKACIAEDSVRIDPKPTTITNKVSTETAAS